MLCKKCGNEIKEEESFCSKCGKKVKLKADKPKVKNKKIICASLVVAIILVIGIVIFSNKNNTDIIDDTTINTDISQDTNNMQNHNEQNFSKYVQEDNNSYCGKSFKNVDFDSFKNKVKQVWFEKEQNNNLIDSTEKSFFGNEYGEWQKYNGSNSPYEELKKMYSKNGSLNGYWIISQYMDIYYNKDKTAVIGFSISVSEYYLNKIGNDKFNEIVNEVIDCFEYDFKVAIQERMNSQEIYEDFDVDIQNITTNNEKYRTFFCRCNVNSTDTNNSYFTNNTDISNDTKQTNGIRQNVKYKATVVEMQDNSAGATIEFNNNTFKLEMFLYATDTEYSANVQTNIKGTYVENENNLILYCDKVSNLISENGNSYNEEEKDAKEVLEDNVINGKISNNGKTITIELNNEEMKFEL